MSFANTIIIMTSNLGANILLEAGNTPQAKAAVMEVVRRHFRPEFLNRLDEIVQVGDIACAWLSLDEMMQLGDIPLAGWWLASSMAAKPASQA